MLYFKMNFDIVVSVFSDESRYSIYDMPFDHKKLEKLEGPWTLYRITNKNFSNLQLSYAKIFYWAGYFGDMQICQFFMRYLGMSPFTKLFMGQDVIGACVKGG